ncbi:MAG: hypothetical protein NUV82_01705 [Candidatus Komeilibacteria bacterium]|nr:hypothetical protein [Candidatus Komeilibacteria bacterium]
MDRLKIFWLWCLATVYSLRYTSFSVILVSVWVLLKSVFLGIILDVAADIIVYVYENGERLVAGTTEAVSAVDSTAVSDSLVVSSSPIYQQLFAQTPLVVAIDWPYLILAFAAGRMATKLNNGVTLLVSFLVLAISLSPQFDQASSLSEFIPYSLLTLGAYGLGAVFAKKKELPINAESRIANKKGLFTFEIQCKSEEDAQNEKVNLETIFYHISYASVKDLAIEERGIGRERRCMLRGNVIGNLFHLLKVKKLFSTRYGEISYTSPVMSVGGSYNK